MIVDPSKPLLDGGAGDRRQLQLHVNGDSGNCWPRALKIPIQKPFEKLPKKAQQALSEGRDRDAGPILRADKT